MSKNYSQAGARRRRQPRHSSSTACRDRFA